MTLLLASTKGVSRQVGNEARQSPRHLAPGKRKGWGRCRIRTATKRGKEKWECVGITTTALANGYGDRW